MRTDKELLDGLEWLVEHGDCPGIINDDDGHWAVSGTGTQDVVFEYGPQSIHTSFFVKKEEWRDTIREAIEAYLDSSGVPLSLPGTPK